MANSNATFLFKKLPDLSYRSHKLASSVGSSASDFEIRPAFLERVKVPQTGKTSASAGRFWLTGTSGSMADNVTGVPPLVELDDAFNALDPGQLLRESAAAANRMLSDPTPGRRASTSEMVDVLLRQIYAPRSSRLASEEPDEDADDESSLSSFAGDARFSPAKCSEALKRKGDSDFTCPALSRPCFAASFF